MAASATDTSQENGPQCEERQDTIIDVTDVRDPKWAPECCIYKVPKRLRDVKKEAYTPKLISIGPVHHNKDELKDMQMVKECYFKAFFSRTKGQKEFACIIEERKDEICKCYAPEISPRNKNENFVKMVLLDSIFIIELFMRSYKKEENDYILSKPWLKEGIMQDLILLENQLPFFILDKLYQHFPFKQENDCTSNFLELACNYFFSSKEIPFEKEVKHFTDLRRNFFFPPNQKPGKPIVHRHSATKLDMAGLIFQNGEGEEEKRHFA